MIKMNELLFVTWNEYYDIENITFDYKFEGSWV